MVSNIYAPNNPGKQFFSETSSWLLRPPHLPLIVGGDFNTILHPIDDTSSSKCLRPPPKTPDLTHFASTMECLHFLDVWRLSHPADREFTFYSNPHNIFTRIDYLLCTEDLVPMVSGADIHDIAISDHAPISIELENPDIYPNPKI